MYLHLQTNLYIHSLFQLAFAQVHLKIWSLLNYIFLLAIDERAERNIHFISQSNFASLVRGFRRLWSEDVAKKNAFPSLVSNDI